LSQNIKITTENLVSEFISGNKAALGFIYDAYSGALYGILLKMTRSEELSQDLLQETFIKIWKNHDKYDPDKGTLYTWMLNLTRNNCIDYLRSKRNKNQQQNRELDSLVYGLESKSGFNPDHIGLKSMLNQLPAEQKEIITLSYFEGFTQKEISEEFDIPLGTVKSRAKAAMDKLRKVMSDN
jgi:RNA polymerase sigma-70 factor (ECF subfamily)